MIFRECDIRNKQRSFHNKGVEITDRGDKKTSAPMRCSHESVSKETAVLSGLKTGATVVMICRRNVHCSGTEHSSSVTRTAEDD